MIDAAPEGSAGLVSTVLEKRGRSEGGRESSECPRNQALEIIPLVPFAPSEREGVLAWHDQDPSWHERPLRRDREIVFG